MNRKIAVFFLATSVLAFAHPADAQQLKVYRVGVITVGGVWYETIEGLRVGLRQLGLEDGKQFVLAIRDTKGDAKVAEEAARNLERLIIDTARDKRLPTMFDFQSGVIKGGLVSYAVSRHEVGRLSAKYVQRILTGVKPTDLPVQGVDKIELVINLKTANQIGLTIAPNVLARADRVIR